VQSGGSGARRVEAGGASVHGRGQAGRRRRHAGVEGAGRRRRRAGGDILSAGREAACLRDGDGWGKSGRAGAMTAGGALQVLLAAGGGTRRLRGRLAGRADRGIWSVGVERLGKEKEKKAYLAVCLIRRGRGGRLTLF
jgi:hypothetical protein